MSRGPRRRLFFRRLRQSLEELRTFSERIEKGLFLRLTVTAAIDRKSQIGGTARMQVERRIKELERMLS